MMSTQVFNDRTFSVNEEKIFKNIKKNAKGQKFEIIKGFFDDHITKRSRKL